jgi:hypothetical protein
MPAGPPGPLPAVVAHADWGSDPRKRQVAMAGLVPGDAGGPRYLVGSLAAAADGRHGTAADLFDDLASRPGAGTSLVGFDFTIGLPRAYAAAVGVGSFPDFLGQIGSPPWQDFNQVAELASEITLHRPFYPRRPGGTTRQQLYAGLGLSARELRRRCDGNDAETLFWTLGRKQAGKASLNGWRLIAQARSTARVALWPFDGSLPELLAGPSRFVVAEAYPREFYRYVRGMPRGRWSKRRRDDRLMCVPSLLAWAESLGVGWDDDVLRRVTDGFAETGNGEDEFDAVVGLLGMIGVTTGRIPVGLPADDPAVLATEGWILGRAA